MERARHTRFLVALPARDRERWRAARRACHAGIPSARRAARFEGREPGQETRHLDRDAPIGPGTLDPAPLQDYTSTPSRTTPPPSGRTSHSETWTPSTSDNHGARSHALPASDRAPLSVAGPPRPGLLGLSELSDCKRHAARVGSRVGHTDQSEAGRRRELPSDRAGLPIAWARAGLRSERTGAARPARGATPFR